MRRLDWSRSPAASPKANARALYRPRLREYRADTASFRNSQRDSLNSCSQVEMELMTNRRRQARGESAYRKDPEETLRRQSCWDTVILLQHRNVSQESQF